jgi:hypothetical protein
MTARISADRYRHTAIDGFVMPANFEEDRTLRSGNVLERVFLPLKASLMRRTITDYCQKSIADLSDRNVLCEVGFRAKAIKKGSSGVGGVLGTGRLSAGGSGWAIAQARSQLF